MGDEKRFCRQRSRAPIMSEAIFHENVGGRVSHVYDRSVESTDRTAWREQASIHATRNGFSLPPTPSYAAALDTCPACKLVARTLHADGLYSGGGKRRAACLLLARVSCAFRVVRCRRRFSEKPDQTKRFQDCPTEIASATRNDAVATFITVLFRTVRTEYSFTYGFWRFLNRSYCAHGLQNGFYDGFERKNKKRIQRARLSWKNMFTNSVQSNNTFFLTRHRVSNV